MDVCLFLIDLGTSLFLLILGLYFYKAKDKIRASIFLTGDIPDKLDKERICSDSGKRLMVCSIPFLVGIVIDRFNLGVGTKLAFSVFLILVIAHVIDMSINRNKRYKL